LQYNLSGEPVKTSNDQITEVLEHLLHTLVRFALPGAYADVFLLIDERSENIEIMITLFYLVCFMRLLKKQ
tara:strand:+ start:35 stop:247 length:213 start_codon:yes stop_codon:yes gene_type:complete